MAEAGLHLPTPPSSNAEEHHHNHDDHHDHEHGFEMVEVLRVAFVAPAAEAVWFRLWEPFLCQVRAERLDKETIFGKIIEAVENAERPRAPIQIRRDGVYRKKLPPYHPAELLRHRDRRSDWNCGRTGIHFGHNSMWTLG